MAENVWSLLDGRSINVQFEPPRVATNWGWFGNRGGDGLEFAAPPSAWTDHAWLRGGLMVQAAQGGSSTSTGTLAFSTDSLALNAVGVTYLSSSLLFSTSAIGFSAAGEIAESGAFSFTTDSLQFSASGALAISGSMGVATDSIQFTASGSLGSLGSSGTLAFSTASIGFAAVGGIAETGAFSFTTDSLQFASSGGISHSGSIAIETESISVAAQGGILFTAALGFETDSISSNGAGTLVIPAVGTLAFTTGSISFNGTGEVTISGVAPEPYFKKPSKSELKHRKLEEAKNRELQAELLQNALAKLEAMLTLEPDDSSVSASTISPPEAATVVPDASPITPPPPELPVIGALRLQQESVAAVVNQIPAPVPPVATQIQTPSEIIQKIANSTEFLTGSETDEELEAISLILALL